MTTQVHVRVPATSANLGPGFDTLGLAFHNELTLGESDHVMVSINGEGAGELAVDGDNLVVLAYGAASAILLVLAPREPANALDRWIVAVVDKSCECRHDGSCRARSAGPA